MKKTRLVLRQEIKDTFIIGALYVSIVFAVISCVSSFLGM